jgi:hypothetical protein
VTATDPNNLPITISLVAPPAGATVTPGGAFHWRPTSTQAGNYTLRFQAANPQTASTCDVAVTVTDRPFTPPGIACPGSQVTYELHPTTLAITSSDPDGDAPTYLSRNLPAGALFSAAGLFTWTPSASQAGTFFPQFIVTDGDLRDSCTVQIDVQNQDTPLGPNEAKITRIDDIRPDQGGWVRVRFVSATNDRASGSVSGYDVWRQIAGPVLSAATGIDAARRGRSPRPATRSTPPPRWRSASPTARGRPSRTCPRSRASTWSWPPRRAAIRRPPAARSRPTW